METPMGDIIVLEGYLAEDHVASLEKFQFPF